MTTEMMTEFIVCMLAGLGAGVATGFAGLSAATFISPMLIAFLNVPAFEAVGISLAADVLASAASAVTYGKRGNIDIKKGKPLMVSVIVFTIIGTLVSFFITSSDAGNSVMSEWMILASFLLGLKFLIFPEQKKKEEKKKNPALEKIFTPRNIAILSGVYIGFVCGFQGTGGGMMMLFVLTSLLHFEFKKAVGTSVFIMAFTACIGAVSHFAINGTVDISMFVICVLFTLVGAQLAASAANHMREVTLNRATGVLLSASGLIMLLAHIFL